MLIAIDHGNKLVKTVNCPPFTSGLVESEVQPFGSDVLKYQGKYYQLSDQRIPYRRDKTEDERFFILTLFAIAKEIEAADNYTPHLRPTGGGAAPGPFWRPAADLYPVLSGAWHDQFYLSEKALLHRD